jgi:heavy metal translocating P-type ATPase
MPDATASRPYLAPSEGACDLCGLPLRAGRVEARFADGNRGFCCLGCRQVFTILIQAAGSADPVAFRRTELFRRCQESGIIPRSEADLPGENPAVAGDTPTQEADAPASVLTLTLTVGNMWCPACAWLIETALSRQPGVFSATCTFVTDRLHVQYDPVATDPSRIIAALRSFGYLASSPAGARDLAEDRGAWIRFGISAFLTMNVMMLSFALYFGFFTELPAESVASLSWPLAAAAVVVVGYGGAPLFRRAWSGLTQAAFSLETLVAVGALSAFGLSTVGLFSGSIHLYYDTACMLITLVLLGKIIERRAKNQVLDGLEGFLTLMPAKVRILDEAFPEGRYVASAQLTSGDLFRVDENDIVAADGVVVSGEGAIDESSITGEPLPEGKRPGDPIRSGSRVHRGGFTVCAERVGGESTLGQMIAVVEKTLAGKTAGDGRVAKLLQWFVPSILLLAAATGAAVYHAGQSLEASVLRAVTVTVISCPCALGIAIPLARVAGVALAARRGVLVRSFSAFDKAAAITSVVLDKTGTVTRGSWRLLGVIPFGDFTREKALALAHGLEQGASHPIALELLSEAREHRIRPERVSVVQIEENGVSGLWEGLEARIGSAEFLIEEFTGQQPWIQDAFLNEQGRSFVYLGAGGRPAAVFIFGDELRSGIDDAVAELRRMGYPLVLVSGDGVETTQAVGRRLGIPEAYGGQLPADKSRLVSDLQRRGKRVAMVGDGVNDAPALAQADLSLAVFAGGSLVRDVADATLMRSEPAQIPEFLAFGGAVYRKIRQNLLFTFIYNAVSIPIAMSGLLSPLVAVCAMLLSSLSVIGNTFLLVRKHS